MLNVIMYVNLHFRKLHKLMNSIILAINVHETLRPLGSSLGPLQIVYVALNTKSGVAKCNSLHEIEININILDGPIGRKIPWYYTLNNERNLLPIEHNIK